jgi:shikimate kinase
MKNIVLCGFMGSGKTTVGKRLLAEALGMEFTDTDALHRAPRRHERR